VAASGKGTAMKTLAPALALAIAACGSSPPPKMTCDAGLCAGVCCDTGKECLSNQAGNKVCATPCTLPSDCAEAEPCCMPILVGGKTYMGQSICAANPSPATAYTCTCGANSGCGGGNSMECAPLVGGGLISGPYVCLPNDAENHDGCKLTSTCKVSGQFCATDQSGDQFCSTTCSMDSDCKNTGVACCNATCPDSSAMCCGLCGH
jgi:hypothetical protein